MNAQQVTATLQNILNKQCKHSSSWGNYGYECINAAKLFISALNAQVALQVADIDSFYKYINKRSYYYNSSCMSSNDKDVIEILLKLFSIHPPPLDFVQTLIEHPDYDRCYDGIPKNNFAYYLDIMIQFRLKHEYLFKSKNEKTLIDIILKNIDLDKNLTSLF